MSRFTKQEYQLAVIYHLASYRHVKFIKQKYQLAVTYH